MIRTVVLDLITSAATSGLLIWLFKDWISARLKANIGYEYDRKLETYRAQLKIENDLAILNLKTDLAREATLHAAAHASFAEGQKASIERKLNAVDRLWTFVVQFKSHLPPVLTFIDVLSVDEYRRAKDDPTFQKLAANPSIEDLARTAMPSIEEVRPFVGEYLWAVFFSYRATLMRIVLLLEQGRTDAEKIEWHKDTGTRHLLEAVLTTAELQQFDQKPFGKISWLLGRMESKILAAAEKVVSGESFGIESLEQAKLIQQRVAQLSDRKS